MTPDIKQKAREEFESTIRQQFPCQMIGGVPHYDLVLLREPIIDLISSVRENTLEEVNKAIEFIYTDIRNEAGDEYIKRLKVLTALAALKKEI